ncbi:PBECR2 nuclease fold domain-containing protein, partial [Campylobacter upsaliensis]
MQFNFNFEAFEQSGKEKNEAINYLKSLNSSIDFDKLEQETKGDENAIYEALKGGNFSFSKPSIEQTRQKLLKNKENEALKAEFNAGLSWLDKKQNFNFYDFKKAKEKANSKQGLIQADLKAKEKELKRKEALFETRLKERGIIAKSFDDMLDQSGAYLGADLLEKGLNKLGFKDENYIFESEKEDIKNRALKSVREKLERGDLEFNEREKHALRSKYDELDYKKALEKEKERLRLSQKSGNFSEAEREFIENDLGFFNTLFNDDKENIKEFKEKVKSEGVISSEIIKAANTLKAFDEGNLFKNMLFADEKEKKEFQQNFLNDAYKIAELSGFDDVGLDKKGELYFIKDEQKYLVNTGFFDNFAQLLNDTKFEFAGGVLGGLKGFNSGKSAKGKVAKSILGAAAGSFGGAFLDAKIADMYLNRESDFKKNLDFAIQAGLLSMAGDGVILSVKPLAKGLYKGVKKGGEILGEYSILGTLKTLPQQNIQAAEKIIDEVFSPKMKEELKAAQEEFGGSVRGEDLKNAFFANLQKKFTQKYGENDSKTKSVAKIAEIFNTNSLKTRQQAMLDLVRSDTHGSTLAYLLEIAKDDVKIQSNLKNMLNLASSNVEKNLKNLNINAREIKHILDEFEAGNKAAFKEVESQIARLYDENYRVVLSKGEYENIKEEFRQNGVNLEEMTPFLRDLEANVFNENGVTFTQLNNFRKNLNFYIFNKDKTPNFINTLKKIGENILKNEIDKGIDNIFSQNKAAYESIKELYSTSLKDYATLKSLNESIKNLKLQDSAKSADEVLNSLIKYAKGQGEKGVNNLQKIKDYLGEENNAFLEMQILNKLFKESVVENDRASLRVFDSEGFLGRVRELVGENELYAKNELDGLSSGKLKEILQSWDLSKENNANKKLRQIVSKLENDEAKELSKHFNFKGKKPLVREIDSHQILHALNRHGDEETELKRGQKALTLEDISEYENIVKNYDFKHIQDNGRIIYAKQVNGHHIVLEEVLSGQDKLRFFDMWKQKGQLNKEVLLSHSQRPNANLDQMTKRRMPSSDESITQPLFKSKEAREFLELVEGFHKLYKNDASIAKNLVQGTASQLSTSIATSAEGAIKQKVVKGGFDPIFRLLPDKILFGLFAKQIQGGALRYHLKKALSRSLNYDDFKIKLEKELKRTNFNSNTSRLIDEFMQNLEDFNREKEQFLEAKRIEQARIKEEERKRAEEIYKRQEEIYQAQEANNLKDILEAEEKPLKDEFGVNFEGFKGKEAIEKLLGEQRGQVKGAFYKEGLGEIDLVWGDKNYGLEHILNKHGGEFENLAKELSEAVENGKIVKDDKGRLRLEYENKIVGIKDNWKGEKTAHWVVTAYVKKEKEASLYTSASFTKGEALPLNSKESIAQKAKNDEVLEAEVIEEVGLNEPMKFLEFQQRKLLTYIKENTPLKLLEHKKELKTRDILNFLEQSALNGKQKVFLMRNLERDLGKIELKIKENESVKAKIKNTYEISQSEAKELGEHFNFKGKKPLLRELRENEIKHALKSHGNKESEEARGNIAITLQDIEANYPKITQEFDEKFFTQKGVIYVKQVNGHHIVIEEALSGQDKLIFKTMWKTKGNYNKEVLLKNAKTSPYPQNADEAVRLETISKQELEQSNPQQSHLSTDESIAQNSQEAKIKEAVKNHNAIYKEILDNDYRFTDERSVIFRKRKRELIENLAKDEKVQAFTSQWGYPFKKDGELRGIGLNYKAKVYGKGEHKMMYVDGGGFGSKAFQKKKERLLELEKERLQEAFKADFGIDGFISKYVENDFFETLWGETKAYKGTDYGWGVHPREYYPYYENRIMPSDTITQAKEKLQKEKSSWSVKRQETKGSEDIIFTDKKGKEHTLTKETQKAWLEAFNLKSLEDSYIPNHNEAIKQALEGKEIKLQLGSLKKLVAQGREKYIPQIKEVLDRPEAIMRDDMGEYLFIKHLKDDDYFVNVSFDNGEYLVSISNGIKETRNLNNKLKKGGEFIYQSPNFNFISQKLLQTSQYSANKIDEDIIAQNAKSERAEFESFKDKMKELYTKYEGLNPYDKSESQLKSKLLNEEIEPEIKKEFKSIIDKFKGADNKDKILRVIKENKEELSDYLAFHIALRKDIYIDGYGEGRYDFYDKSIRGLFKFRENKPGSEIYDDSNYRTLAALENLSNKNTSLYFSFRDLNGKVGEFKTYPRIQDLLFYDLPLGYDLKNAVILSTKDKHLKEKLIEKLKAYIDKKIYADFLEYKIKDLESRNPKNSYFENYKDEKWDEEALKSFKKELEDLRANEKGTKLEAKGSEDIIFTDKKGKEHTLTKETQKAWLEAFNLKSLEEAYIPNFKAEVKEAINRVLGGEEIKLTKGSFEKLLKEKRLKYLDRIKPTLENPHSVILQNDGALIFARDYGEEKYFTSVARNDSGEWIIRSNAPKSKNGLNNKILNGGKEIYNDQAASQINASNPYDDIANSNIKLDNESIAQNSHYLELVKEYGEENAKSIIKQKILGENIAQVLENEEEKFIYKKGDREFEFKIKDVMGQFEMQYDELNLKSDLNKSFLKALNKLKIGYEVLENEPVRIRYFKQEAKERKPKETKPSADKTLGQIQKDMRARLKELKAQAKENYERYKNEDKALQKELTNTKDLFKAFEKEFNETEGTILISRAKRRKNDAEGKVETSVFLGNELALRNALDRWERYSGYSEENALEVKERLELLRSYVKRLEKHREDIKAKREQLEQDYQQNEAARSKEMGVIGNYNILSNLKGVSENELYEPFLEKVGGYLSKADFYERHLPFAREEFQKLFNLTPLKEFGTNYAEFYRDGKGAVEKLLKEAEDFKQRGEKGEFKGQVSGAFYKEGLGEIDLVWGDENFGLRHIIDKHGDEFEDIAAELDEIIAKGVLEKGEHRYFIKHNDYKGMIALDYKGKESNAWILTLYKDKSALNPAYQHQIKHNTNTSSETRANGEFENSNIKNANLQKEKVDKLFHGDAEVISAQGKFNELEALNLTDEDIIPQQKIKFAMEKFHYDEKKAKDLLEWHKNSHALTKDENGLPKVFYHGTYSKFRVFRRVGKASQQGFFFTPSQKATEEYGDITLNTFLNIKNPFRADELKINKEADLQKWADILKLDYDKEKYESFKDLKTKLEKVKEATKKAGFKFHSASGGGVYVIDNKGRNSFINLEELDKENKRVVEAFKGLETEDIYFYYVVRNEFDLVLYALNKNDRYFHTSGRDEVKRVLEKLGYDGVVLNDTIITVFNSNQIKHIDNKGSFTDTKGNVTSKKPKDKEAEFSY